MLTALFALLPIALLAWLYLRFDRQRYRGRATAAQRPTGEDFRDPATGQRMRVYEDPETGAREYRPE